MRVGSLGSAEQQVWKDDSQQRQRPNCDAVIDDLYSINNPQTSESESREANLEMSNLSANKETLRYSHQGGLSERDLREMEDERTLWGMYESTNGWLCVSNMADRAVGTKQGPQVKLRDND